jgi:hypothetical protein
MENIVYQADKSVNEADFGLRKLPRPYFEAILQCFSDEPLKNDDPTRSRGAEEPSSSQLSMIFIIPC